MKSGTPDAIIARLNEAINKALAKASVREAFAKIAAEPAGGTPGEFGAHIKSQIAHWGKVVKDAGIKIPSDCRTANAQVQSRARAPIRRHHSRTSG